MKNIIQKMVTYLLVLLFVSMIPILIFYEESTALIWTTLLPLVPVFIVIIGYSQWRDICPLAFFSKISQNLEWFGKRKVPHWFEDNFYSFQFVLLIIAFSLRLTVLNFDNMALALFILFVISASFITNLFFRGKSWCNFFCPVGMIEKIYCLSNSKNMQTNSACNICSACKKDCPDIDMENNYWKEKNNEQKTFVFYAFSGLVLGFYLYYYLQSGSFETYNSGIWTRESFDPFLGGFFFAPFVPIIVAVPLTLIVFSFISFFLFKSIERGLWSYHLLGDISEDTLQHRMKVISFFVSFNIFYLFAGVPTFQHYPLAYGIFYFMVVVLSTLLLYKELFRQEGFFIQDRFALKIIFNSKGKIPFTSNLQEIYYTYIHEQKSKKEKLSTYKETILDLLEEGTLSASSMIVLDKLRKQMDITEREHLSILRKLEMKNTTLFDVRKTKSFENIYQHSSYKQMLENALTQYTELSSSQIDVFRKQFCITEEIHKEIMDEILHSNENVQEEIIGLLKQMNNLRRIHKSIYNDHSREIRFLKYVIRNEVSGLSKKFFILLDVMYKDHKKELKIIKKAFKYKNIGKSSSFELSKLTFMNETILKEIMNIQKEFINEQTVKDNQPMIKYLLTFPSIQIATASLLCCLRYGESLLSTINLERFLKVSSDGVSALAHKIQNKTDDLTTYEGMSFVHQVSLFHSIKFFELKKLVLAMSQKVYKKGDYLIKQGTKGNTLFIIISGEVEVLVDEIVVNHLKENDYFGDIALLSDMTRVASVKAISQEIKVVTLSKNEFKAFVEKNPEISMKLMKKMIERLMGTQQSRLIKK